MLKKTFVIEIGTEELPAKILYDLITSFYKNFITELKLYNIKYKKIEYFATPRRLALKIIDLENTERIKKTLKKGPALKYAFDKYGEPTQSANSWANHIGIKVNQAEHLKNEKGQWLVYYLIEKEEKIELLLPKITETSLKKINIANVMRWDSSDIKFFRPIRNICMILDSKIINSNIFNIISNNQLNTHIAYKEKKIYLHHAEEYPSILFKNNYIIANYEVRKETIQKEITKLAKKVNGYIKINSYLLEEITSIVESPKAILATFQEKYIKYIPNEVLIYIIEKQQKCFPIYYKEKILPYFIFISNIRCKKNNNIILGIEKIMEAKLADIIFFLNKDNQIKLLDYLSLLKNVLFHKNLGTLYDKTIRLKKLVKLIDIKKNNKIHLTQSAMLSKCDLITNMVCEFPELQGIIGMYYAMKNQEKYETAIPIKEQYLPRFSNDQIPLSINGCILSIADKIDTLCGMYLINQIPFSNKDPFALRRAALGIIRIIIEKKIYINLKLIILSNLKMYDKEKIDYIFIYKQIIQFFKSRLLSFYKQKGFKIPIIKSILSRKIVEILDIEERIQAISNFKDKKESQSICLIIKRISNILKLYKNYINDDQFNAKLIQTEEEKKIFKEIKNFNNNTKKLFLEKKYEIILSELKKFENPINNFFNRIKINHDNSEIRNNRLILLKKVEEIFFNIANFSFLY